MPAKYVFCSAFESGERKTASLESNGHFVVGEQHASIGGVHGAPPEVLQVVALAVVAAVRIQLVAHESLFWPLHV